MQLPKLYAQNSDGSNQHWSIKVDGPTFYTEYGRVGSDVVTKSEPTTCVGKNEGKKNETTAEQQAIAEAKAKWKKKLDSGFYEDITKVSEEKFIQPMLAKSYSDYKDKLKFPVYVSTKLDGLRNIVTKNGLFSRNGKSFVAAPHILFSLATVFGKYPDLILDGELYNHEFKDDFNKICSLAKKTKPTEDDLKESKELMQYHIYDAVIPNVKFSDRFESLEFLFRQIKSPCIKLVQSYKCKSHDEIINYYERFISEGYEGLMVRTNSLYQNKRTSDLLKLKEFIDEEFEIVEVLEGVGNRAGMAGSLMLKDDKNQIFNSGIKNGYEFYQSLWRDRKSLVGKMATVQYFSKTPPPNSLPRFPVTKSVRDYE